MYSKDQIAVLVEQYIEHKLPDHKLDEVKNLIETDADWKSEYESQFSAHEFVKELGLLGIQDDISKDLAEMKDPTQYPSSKFWIAGAGLIAFGTLLFVTTSLKKDNQKKESEITEIKKIVLDTTSESPQIKILEAEPLSQKIISKNKDQEQTLDLKYSPEIKNMGDEKIELKEFLVQNTPNTSLPDQKENTINPEKTTQKSTTHTDLCINYKPEANFKITPSLFADENGIIEIIPKSGWGNSKVKMNANEFSDKLVFENLKPGTYTIETKNENNCVSVLGNFTVANTNCSPTQEEQFSPLSDRTWKTQLNENLSCDIQIMNKRKEIIFEKSNIKNDFFEWNGNDSKNEMVTTGLYKVFIQYKNGERCLLSLTVFE